MANEKRRIVELQRQVKIARLALTRIALNAGRNTEAIASKALDEMWPLDTKQPLQRIVGHESSRRGNPA